MMKNVVVVAPHPDDETLGCGGTLLKLKNKGYKVHWIIVTKISKELGYSDDKINSRLREIDEVAKEYDFDSVVCLDILTAQVDNISMDQLVRKFSEVISRIKPSVIFLPFYGDVHTDHKYVAEACISCTKWFRYPFVQSVLFYETISETDFNINRSLPKFNPNVFVDISGFLDLKLKIANIYDSEMGEFPFPRSVKTIESLAYLRGSQSGFDSAESFELLNQRIW